MAGLVVPLLDMPGDITALPLAAGALYTNVCGVDELFHVSVVGVNDPPNPPSDGVAVPVKADDGVRVNTVLVVPPVTELGPENVPNDPAIYASKSAAMCDQSQSFEIASLRPQWYILPENTGGY